VEHREKDEDFWNRVVLWLLKVLAELLVDEITSRSHMISLFDSGGWIFQSGPPLTIGITREVLEMININEATCTCGKWQQYHWPCSYLICIALYKTWTMCNLLMISTPTYHTKIHVVLIFKPCLIHHYGLYILVQMCKDVQLYDERMRDEENPLIYIIRLMLERGIHWIDVVYAVKKVMDKKISQFFKNQPCIYKGLNSIAFLKNLIFIFVKINFFCIFWIVLKY